MSAYLSRQKEKGRIQAVKTPNTLHVRKGHWVLCAVTVAQGAVVLVRVAQRDGSFECGLFVVRE